MQQVLKIVDTIVETTFNDFCQEICSVNYYKNRFLAQAINTNRSLQCICREYARFLYASSDFERHETDKYHANLVLTFLKNYVNTKAKKYINSLLHEFLDEVEEHNKFLILFCTGREKGFRSVEAKIRYKLIMPKVLNHIISNFDKIKEFKEFSEKEVQKAMEYLEAQLDNIEKKDPLKDFYGFRLIVDQYGKDCTEEDRIHYCYGLRSHIIAFFENKGYQVIEQKDYIKKPKPKSKYQSLHITVLVLGIPVEIQIRTSAMEYKAEYGSASHDTIYKDTVLQNFLQNFLCDLSKESSQISNENNGLLDCLSLIKRLISNVFDNEIPQTPEDFKPFEDIDFLRNLMDE